MTDRPPRFAPDERGLADAVVVLLGSFFVSFVLLWMSWVLSARGLTSVTPSFESLGGVVGILTPVVSALVAFLVWLKQGSRRPPQFYLAGIVGLGLLWLVLGHLLNLIGPSKEIPRLERIVTDQVFAQSRSGEEKQKSLGGHDFCFLTYSNEEHAHGSLCQITFEPTGGIWTLKAKRADCRARCVDYSLETEGESHTQLSGIGR